MKLSVNPLVEEQIHTFISWAYPEPYNIYDMSSEEGEDIVSFFLDPQNGYFAITADSGELLGFCNFGADAQVPGGDYSEDGVDIGMGMRPDLTGQGHGRDYADPVFSFAQKRYPQQRQRVTIAEFNHRAQRLCAHFGFVKASQFTKEGDGRPFIIMVREPQADQEPA